MQGQISIATGIEEFLNSKNQLASRHQKLLRDFSAVPSDAFEAVPSNGVWAVTSRTSRPDWFAFWKQNECDPKPWSCWSSATKNRKSRKPALSTRCTNGSRLTRQSVKKKNKRKYLSDWLCRGWKNKISSVAKPYRKLCTCGDHCIHIFGVFHFFIPKTV